MDARNRASVLAFSIEAVVDLAIEELPSPISRELLYFRIPLIDGCGNSQAHLKLAIDTIRHLIASETPTLIACSAGLSRSPLLTAAAIAGIRHCSLNEALKAAVADAPSDVSTALLMEIRRLIDEPA